MAQKYRQQVFQPPKGAAALSLIRNGDGKAIFDVLHFLMKDAHRDPTPHPKREQQALAVGERLVTLLIAAIYVTPLRCTHQTQTALAKMLQITPKVEEDLRAIYLVDWDSRIYRKKNYAK